MCELVSEFMPDVTLLDGKSCGGKAKSGIIGIGEVRLVGWEFDRCSDQVGGSSWAKKMIILRLEKRWYGVVQ